MTQLFTDTSANLPVEIIDEYGIEVVPFSYTIDGVEYIPEREFDGKAFYAAMRAGSEVKTSMVNAGTFIERFKAALDAGKDVLYIGMSGGISGTANAALMAKQELTPVAMPGKRPYKEYKGIPVYPTSSSKCSGCGTCAQECPTEAIDPGDPQHTDKSKCISCMRCVSMCPFSQRRVPKAMQLAASAALIKMCAGRKEPKFYL